MKIGSGLAVLGMLVAVAVVGWKEPEAGVALGFLAFLATMIVSLK